MADRQGYGQTIQDDGRQTMEDDGRQTEQDDSRQSAQDDGQLTEEDDSRLTEQDHGQQPAQDDYRQPTQDDSQQDARDEPWQPPHYDPGAHRERISSGPHPLAPPEEPPSPQPDSGVQQDYWQYFYREQPEQDTHEPPEPGYEPQSGYGPQPDYQPGGGSWPQSHAGHSRYAPPPAQPRRAEHTVRYVLVGFGALAVAIVVIGAVMIRGHQNLQPTTTGHTSTPTTAAIGSAITLNGNSDGEQLSVTVTKVISNGSPGDDLISAPAGDRLYAVQFRLRDTGSAAYSDSPANGAAVVDSAGQSYQPATADTVAGCQAFPETENIARGSSGLGCIVFEVPKTAQIAKVEFTLDSGLGPQTGQWNAG